MARGTRSTFSVRMGILITLMTAPFLSDPAAALPVTYIEVLDDIDDSGLARDLRRTRILQDGSMVIEDDDTAIVTEHAMTDNFGLTAFFPITFSHVFLENPFADTYLFGSIALTAFDTDEGLVADFILLEGTLVGALTTGDGLEITTTLATTDDFLIRTVLVDSRLDVTVIPLIEFDGLQLRSSRLIVAYEPLVIPPDPTPVPEPASLALMMGGLGMVSVVRWRRREQTPRPR